MTTTNLSFEWFGGVSPAGLLLATDFDGTLAEIVPQPSDAQPLPESINALRRLATRVRRVAVISGRTTAALRELLPVPGLDLRGDYGLGDATAQERQALSRFNAEMAGLVPRWQGVRLESKPGSTSIHVRAQPEAAGEVLAATKPVAERFGLQARPGRMVVEVMPERARKEVALQSLLNELQPAAVFFAGDDSGDAAGLRLVAGLEVPHLAVGVASGEAEAGLFESCDLVLQGPVELARLLSQLADWSESGPGPG